MHNYILRLRIVKSEFECPGKYILFHFVLQKAIKDEKVTTDVHP